MFELHTKKNLIKFGLIRLTCRCIIYIPSAYVNLYRNISTIGPPFSHHFNVSAPAVFSSFALSVKLSKEAVCNGLFGVYLPM